MQLRRLGYTSLNLSVIGLGTWAMGGGGWKFGWGPQNDKESINTILQAIESGVNWIDTAPVYGFGHAEEVVGKVIKSLRDKVIIATKCGRLWREDGNIYGNLKKESIHREVEVSLRRLGIDVIDLYQIHWPEPEEDIEEAWSTIADLVEEGKIRYAGVSNFSVSQLKRIQPIHPVASLQPPYSLIERDIESEMLFDYCAANNIGVIVYSPLQKGLITGKFSRERVYNLPQDDHRRNDPDFQEPKLGAHLKLVEDLRPIAKKNDRTIAQLAIAWVLRRPEVTSAIVGARKPSQIEENIGATDWKISEEDYKRIETILDEMEKKIRG
ncbi:aldo/keto reductase [candidate division WOR-3 bacterium]|nr:aldo/keto reductase [candidate division WOR-3 bacterium]